MARSGDDIDLAPVWHAIASLLAAQMPFPGIVLDRHWNLIDANDAAKNLLGAAGFASHPNLLDMLAAQPASASAILNWSEVVGLTLERLRTEIQAAGDDPVLSELERKLAARFETDVAAPDINRAQAIIPMRLKIGKRVISLFSTIAQFGSVQDLTLADLKVELMFPMDETSAGYFSR